MSVADAGWLTSNREKSRGVGVLLLPEQERETCLVRREQSAIVDPGACWAALCHATTVVMGWEEMQCIVDRAMS